MWMNDYINEMLNICDNYAERLRNEELLLSELDKDSAKIIKELLERDRVYFFGKEIERIIKTYENEGLDNMEWKFPDNYGDVFNEN